MRVSISPLASTELFCREPVSDTGDALVYTFSPLLNVFNWLPNQKTVCSLWMFYKLLEGKKCILNTVEAHFTLKFFHCEKNNVFPLLFKEEISKKS